MGAARYFLRAAVGATAMALVLSAAAPANAWGGLVPASASGPAGGPGRRPTAGALRGPAGPSRLAGHSDGAPGWDGAPGGASSGGSSSGASSWGSAGPGSTKAKGAAGGGTALVVEPAIEPVITDNFNPFDTKSPLGAMGAPYFVYEPLLEYNELQVDQYYPWLAQSWTFSTSGLTLTFTLRSGVRWDDGSPFTSADVAYTFNLLKANPSLAGGLPIVSAVAAGPGTFVLTFSKPAYAYLYDIARVPIVKAGFARGDDPATYVVKDPDGTGPYVLARPGDVTAHQAVLTARPGYWQTGGAPIARLVFPAYKGTAAVQAALAAGDLDWAGNFMPDVESAFEQKDTALNHFWAPPVDCIGLQLNLARYPFTALAVRQAVSAAVGRQALSDAVSSGYDPPATSGSAMVVPLDDEYLSNSQRGDTSTTAQIGLSGLTMQQAGYVRDAAGYWSGPSGHVLSFSIAALAGSSNVLVATVVSRQLQAAGFDASVQVLSSRQWAAAMAKGSFDSAVSTGRPGPSPYYAYQEWLSAPAAVPSGADGTRAAAALTSDLAAYRDNPPGSAAAVDALRTLASYVSSQVPVVPLVYGVAWAEFSTRHATGWPDGSDPYEPGTPAAPFDEYTVLQLSAARG